MGEIADMMLEGILCQCCGVYIDEDAQGVPRTCPDCEDYVPEPRRTKGVDKGKRVRGRTKPGGAP